MGYTTSFEGQFDCYRIESEMAGQFLKAIYLDDHADAALAAFADWLTDQGDPRGEQVAMLCGKIDVGPGRGVSFWRMFGLTPEHAAYLKQFNSTRRMRRDPAKARLLSDPLRIAVGLPVGEEGEYFVGGEGYGGQDRDASILDYNWPPGTQPGLWCGWQPNEAGTAIVWDGGEKFYDYVEWLEYLIERFLEPWGYVLNGRMDWQGEEDDDRGVILVRENQVEPRRLA